LLDIIIVGSGISGCFCAHQILSKKKDLKVAVFDIGRPPMKRRLQMFGFGGLLPNSDGKLYLSDTKRVSNIVGDKKAKDASETVFSILKSIRDYSTVKDNGPSRSISDAAKISGFKLVKNSYIPLFSPHIHGLLKYFADEFENNIQYYFDQEVVDIIQNQSSFTIHTSNDKYKCKRVLLATGRSGWRWAANTFDKLGLIKDNSIARYGIRIEMLADTLKSFNKSTCSFTNSRVNIGPFSWRGTVVPEDHCDMAVANFRSNEERWESDRVSFDFIGNVKTENGFGDTDRIGKLTFLLANDRVSKERVSSIMNDKSKILTFLDEYKWIKDELQKFSAVVPEVLTKAYFHAPCISPLPPTISLGSNLSTDIGGLFVAGEIAGVSGLLAAAEMGVIAGNSIVRGL
jgi:uncharacterized FAD-dependent dehydrogenase